MAAIRPRPQDTTQANAAKEPVFLLNKYVFNTYAKANLTPGRHCTDVLVRPSFFVRPTWPDAIARMFLIILAWDGIFLLFLELFRYVLKKDWF